MTDEPMDVDPPAPAAAPANAMAALMANAKGKAKAMNGNGTTMTDEELKALNDKEGLPWSAAASRTPGPDPDILRGRELTVGWRSIGLYPSMTLYRTRTSQLPVRLTGRVERS